jgi:tetratricopeptide (TPR) repeat protein
MEKQYHKKKQNKVSEALIALAELIKIDPGNRIALMEKARCLKVIGKPNKSIDLLVKSENYLSNHESYHALLGTLYLDVKEYVPARKTIENGLLLNPGSCVLWLLKAFSFVFQENYIQAFNSCKHVLKEIVTIGWRYIFIGLLYSIQKRIR